MSVAMVQNPEGLHMVDALASNQAARTAACKLLDAMSNAKRLQVLALLSDGEMAVGALAEKVELSQSALSQHLSKLRAAGLVSTRREAQTIYYSCESSPVHSVLATLRGIYTGTGPSRIAAKTA